MAVSLTAPECLSASEVKMRYEMERLASFRDWPISNDARPIPLAHAGFYMSGPLEVTCFSCKTRFSSWSKDENVWDKHRQLSPRCEFLQSGLGNIPMTTSDDCQTLEDCFRLLNLDIPDYGEKQTRDVGTQVCLEK